MSKKKRIKPLPYLGTASINGKVVAVIVGKSWKRRKEIAV